MRRIQTKTLDVARSKRLLGRPLALASERLNYIDPDPSTINIRVLRKYCLSATHKLLLLYAALCLGSLTTDRYESVRRRLGILASLEGNASLQEWGRFETRASLNTHIDLGESLT